MSCGFHSLIRFIAKAVDTSAFPLPPGTAFEGFRLEFDDFRAFVLDEVLNFLDDRRKHRRCSETMLHCQPATDCTLLRNINDYPLPNQLLQSAPNPDISGLGVSIL